MAAPEVGLLYQGVAKASAAFKLMKSMVSPENPSCAYQLRVRVEHGFDRAQWNLLRRLRGKISRSTRRLDLPLLSMDHVQLLLVSPASGAAQLLRVPP